MSKPLWTLVALALTAGTASAQTGAWADKLFGGKTAHSFGTAARGTQLHHEFTMTNIYSVPLEITNLRSSCGCLTATATAKTLKPKETATLKIDVDTRKFSGPKTFNIFLTVGPEFVSTATLTVTANARSDVVLNPGEFNFGVVRQGQTPTQTLDVEYAGSADWRVSEVVKSAGAPFEVSINELYRQPPRGRTPGKAGYRLTLKLKADAPPGPIHHELILKTNEPGANQILSVSIEGTVQAELSVSPRLVKLGGVKVGEEATQKVQIRGQRPFRIAAVEGLGDGLAVDLPAEAAPNQILTVRYRPAAAGELRRTLTVRTDQKESIAVEVEARAEP
jgi:hypothetical protein